MFQIGTCHQISVTVHFHIALWGKCIPWSLQRARTCSLFTVQRPVHFTHLFLHGTPWLVLCKTRLFYLDMKPAGNGKPLYNEADYRTSRRRCSLLHTSMPVFCLWCRLFFCLFPCLLALKFIMCWNFLFHLIKLNWDIYDTLTHFKFFYFSFFYFSVS